MDKPTLRERVWDDLEASGVARFPFPPHGRIPNVAGAADAADRLRGTAVWEAAEAVKANPDAPQLPVRRRALYDAKPVFVAVPRLRDERVFSLVDPAVVDPADYDAAVTVSKGDRHAERVAPEALPHVDLIVSGCVAVTEGGARVGKGEGFADLEYAVLAELGRVDADTTVATTVHERQVVPDAPSDPHDVPVDLVVTPERTIHTGAAPADRPTGVDWDALPDERVAEVPILRRLRDDGADGGDRADGTGGH